MEADNRACPAVFHISVVESPEKFQQEIDMTIEHQIEEIDRDAIDQAQHFLADQPSILQEVLAASDVANPIVIRFENIGIYVYRRHWDNPSNWYISLDGSWYFFAKRLANFNKRWADTGPTHSVAIDVEYFDDWDPVNGEVAGTRIHSNVTARGRRSVCPRKQYLKKIASARPPHGLGVSRFDSRGSDQC